MRTSVSKKSLGYFYYVSLEKRIFFFHVGRKFMEHPPVRILPLTVTKKEYGRNKK